MCKLSLLLMQTKVKTTYLFSYTHKILHWSLASWYCNAQNYSEKAWNSSSSISVRYLLIHNHCLDLTKYTTDFSDTTHQSVLIGVGEHCWIHVKMSLKHSIVPEGVTQNLINCLKRYLLSQLWLGLLLVSAWGWRFEATLAATTMTQPSAWQNRWWSSCTMGNVGARFWRMRRITKTIWSFFL